MSEVYKKAKEFKKKYPMTVAWRLKSHAKVIENHLNKDEKVLYVFVGQKNDHWYDIITTSMFVITTKRLLIANKRCLFGYFLYSITPDLFNDLKVTSHLIWGKVLIDTVKEIVYISNLDKKSLDEIETNVTEYMMKEKKKYQKA